MVKKCLHFADLLLKRKFADCSNKQISALYALCGGADCRAVSKELLCGGAKGLSTFLGGYVLECLAKGGCGRQALAIMKEYWGTMLKCGATTFWEDFDIDWINDKTVGIDKFVPDGMSDIHGDFGKFCFKGFRHSLCHGWASGSVSLLSRTVSGVTLLEPGFKKVRISPDDCGLEYAKTKYPTPYGVIEVEIEKGKTNIKVPHGIETV